MSQANKLHLVVTKDINEWFSHVRTAQGQLFRLHLCGDRRRGGFWLKQYADKAGHPDFIKHFTDILKLMEEDKKAAFTLYIKDVE